MDLSRQDRLLSDLQRNVRATPRHQSCRLVLKSLASTPVDRSPITLSRHKIRIAHTFNRSSIIAVHRSTQSQKVRCGAGIPRSTLWLEGLRAVAATGPPRTGRRIRWHTWHLLLRLRDQLQRPSAHAMSTTHIHHHASRPTGRALLAVSIRYLQYPHSTRHHQQTARPLPCIRSGHTTHPTPTTLSIMCYPVACYIILSTSTLTTSTLSSRACINQASWPVYTTEGRKGRVRRNG